jgi:hypothetical protein
MKLPEWVVRMRLGVVTPDANGGVSLMRALGPLSAMAREDRRLELVLPHSTGQGERSMGWSWLAGLDALFMSAPYTRHHGNLARMAKMMGLPVWVDWDDDLCCVPIYNPNCGAFNAEEIRPVLDTLVNLADVVTVSTEEIKRRRTPEGNFGESPKLTGGSPVPPGEGKIRVLPNGCQWPFTEGPRTKRIVWRGWGNHDADLLEVLPAIEAVARDPKNAAWKWAFLGEPPWQVSEAIPSGNLEHDTGADPMLYMGMLCHLRPWLQIVPLKENGFNRCRSNLAWIEASCAGAITLAPAWEEWLRPGVRNYDGGRGARGAGREGEVYDGPDSFKNCLQRAINDFALGQAMAFAKGGTRMMDGARAIHSDVEESRAWIKENVAGKKLNEVRWEIVNGFVARVAGREGEKKS